MACGARPTRDASPSKRLLISLLLTALLAAGAQARRSDARVQHASLIDNSATWLTVPDRLIYKFRQQRQRHDAKEHSQNATSTKAPAPDPPQPDADTPFRWTPRTVAAAVAASVCALLANAAGLGGGPFFLPLFNSLGFDLRLCAGLSHTVVAVGALGAVLHGLLQPSPTDASATLLNFDLAMVLVPAMLFGVSGGVVFNPLSPEWLQTALLGVLLLAITHRTFCLGLQRWRQEQEARRVTPESSPILEPLLAAERGAALLSPVPENEISLLKKPASRGSSSRGAPLGTWAAAFRRIPLLKAGALAALWCAFVAQQYAKSQQPHCSWNYAALVAWQSFVLCGFAAAFAYLQAWRAQRDPASVDAELRKMMVRPPAEPDAGMLGSVAAGGGGGTYQPARMLTTVAVVAGAGFVAGMLGIAGAMLFTPFLLGMGVHPQVVASTAIVIVLFGSGSISLSFWFNDMLNTSYLAVFAPIAFVSSLLGVTACSWAVRRTGRQSVLLLLMSAVLATGAFSVLVFGGQRTVSDIRGGQRIGFRQFCD